MGNYLYLNLMLISFSVPFLFSFHPKLKFYKRWPSFFIAVLLMAMVFIPWDIYFTDQGFWGFNQRYLSSVYIANLPIEEWMFFVMIPYACIFTHYSLKAIFPKWGFDIEYSKYTAYGLLALFLLLMILFFDKNYTFYNAFYAIVITLVVLKYKSDLFSEFFPSYLVVLFPFVLVNGVLTGSWIEEQVVWYNDDQNLGIRFFTIPIEDFVYNYSMLISVLFFEQILNKKLFSLGLIKPAN